MDFISILATVILFTTIGTLIVSLAAYGAYKIRERRKPGKKIAGELTPDKIEPIFLKPWAPR